MDGALLFQIIIGLGILLVVILIAQIILEFLKFDKYSEDSVLQRWGTVLVGQANLKPEFLNKVDAELKNRGLKYIAHRKKIPISVSAKKPLEFLTCRMNEDVSCFISCIDEGNDLAISWLLQDHSIRGIYKTPIIGPLLVKLLKKHSFALYNKIHAFAGVTVAAVQDATEKIMDEKMLDKSKFNRKSSGKLGPL